MNQASKTLILSLVLGLSLNAQDSFKLKVLPVDAKGVVQDLLLPEWKVQIGGKDAKVISQRTPAELGKEGQKWVFVLLPLKDPGIRQMALQSIASFMTTLPSSDAVLVVMRTEKGLQCLTPGFTTQPTLWGKALDSAIADLPAKLMGNSDATFTLPTTAGPEKQESMDAVNAFLAKLPGRTLDRRAHDIDSRGKSVIELYPAENLAGLAKVFSLTLESLEKMCGTIAQVPGEKQIVIFSRNEIDDLASPVWAQKVSQMRSGEMVTLQHNEVMEGRDVINTKLQTELLIREVTLARLALKNTFAKLGLTVHSVGGMGGNYAGAFGEAATSAGGNSFRIDNDLPGRMSQILNTWATRYELIVALPSGTTRPAKIGLQTTRKGLKIFSPSLQ